MKTATFTSTISPQLLSWVTEHAKTTKQTRRDVLEEALRQYQKIATKAELEAGFKRIEAEMDVEEMAEWGMGDYHDIVSSIK